MGDDHEQLLTSRSVRPMSSSSTDLEPDQAVVLAIGGSAGGIQPLIEIVGDLPDDLPAPVLVTMHVGQQTRLPEILSMSGSLRATHARDGEEPVGRYWSRIPRRRNSAACRGLR